MKNQKLISFIILAVLLALGSYKFYIYKNPEKFKDVTEKNESVTQEETPQIASHIITTISSVISNISVSEETKEVEEDSKKRFL